MSKLPDHKDNIMDSLRPLITFERTLSRLIASWLVSVAYNLESDGSFISLDFAQDVSFLSGIILIALVFIILTWIASVMPKIHTDSWCVIALLTICVFKWLRAYGDPGSSFGLTYENNDPIFFYLLAVMVVYGLAALYFLDRNSELLRDMPFSDKKSIAVVSICGIASMIAISLITCLRYRTFSNSTFDLGIFAQMFHYMRTTGLPFVTCERNVLLSHFVVHLSPASYILLPLYILFPSPLTILVEQSLVLLSGIIPLYMLCKDSGLGNKAATLLCAIYSIYPALSAGCFYDFHENCLLTPLLLWTFLFFEKEKYSAMYGLAALVLLVKEDAAIYVLIFAIYIIISRQDRRKQGILLALMSLLWFAFAMHVMSETSTYWRDYYAAIGETASPGIDGVMNYRYGNLIYDDASGLMGAVKTLFVNPGYALTQVFNADSGSIAKLVYCAELLLPLALMPLIARRTSRLLLIAPLLINLLTMYGYQYNIGFHYSFGIAAFLFYASVQNASEMSSRVRQTLISLALISSICLYSVTVPPLLRYYVPAWHNNKDTFISIDKSLGTIPKDASINASTVIVPHVSNHDIVYDVSFHGDTLDVDYVAYRTPYDYQDSIDVYKAAGYEVYDEVPDHLLILKRPGA